MGPAAPGGVAADDSRCCLRDADRNGTRGCRRGGLSLLEDVEVVLLEVLGQCGRLRWLRGVWPVERSRERDDERKRKQEPSSLDHREKRVVRVVEGR